MTEINESENSEAHTRSDQHTTNTNKTHRPRLLRFCLQLWSIIKPENFRKRDNTISDNTLLLIWSSLCLITALTTYIHILAYQHLGMGGFFTAYILTLTTLYTIEKQA